MNILIDNKMTGIIMAGHTKIKFREHPITWTGTKAIQIWQRIKGYKNWWVTHVKIIIGRILIGETQDGEFIYMYLTFEFSIPASKFAFLQPSELNDYKFYKLPVDINPTWLFYQSVNNTGRIYDIGDLFTFLTGFKWLQFSRKLFVCSNGIQHILELLKIHISDEWVPPAFFADKFEEIYYDEK